MNQRITVQYHDEEAAFAPRTVFFSTERNARRDATLATQLERLITAYQWLGLNPIDAQEAAHADAELFATEVLCSEGASV